MFVIIYFCELMYNCGIVELSICVKKEIYSIFLYFEDSFYVKFIFIIYIVSIGFIGCYICFKNCRKKY